MEAQEKDHQPTTASTTASTDATEVEAVLDEMSSPAGDDDSSDEMEEMATGK